MNCASLALQQHLRQAAREAKVAVNLESRPVVCVPEIRRGVLGEPGDKMLPDISSGEETSVLVHQPCATPACAAGAASDAVIEKGLGSCTESGVDQRRELVRWMKAVHRRQMAVTRVSLAVLISPLQDLAIGSNAGSSNLWYEVGGGLDIAVAGGDAKSGSSFDDALHDVSHQLVIHLRGQIHGLLLAGDSGVAGHDVRILGRERRASNAIPLPSESVALKKLRDIQEIGVGCASEEIYVTAKAILLKHMLHQPRRSHWPHSARGEIIRGRWVSPNIQVVVEDSTVAAIQILSHLLATGLSDFHEIK